MDATLMNIFCLSLDKSYISLGCKHVNNVNEKEIFYSLRITQTIKTLNVRKTLLNAYFQ